MIATHGMIKKPPMTPSKEIAKAEAATIDLGSAGKVRYGKSSLSMIELSERITDLMKSRGRVSCL